MASMVNGAPLEMLVGTQHGKDFCCDNTLYLDLDGSYTRVYLLKNSFSCCTLHCIFLTPELKIQEKAQALSSAHLQPGLGDSSLQGVQRRNASVETELGQNGDIEARVR